MPPRSESALPSKKANPLGLTIVNEPKPLKPIVDIIFIHGLGGRSHYTWSYRKDLDLFWPGWLPFESGLEKARISTFGYDSSIWPEFTKNFSSIDDFSLELLGCIKLAATEHIGETPFGQIPIIMVAHSMGGLVAEQACNKGIKNLKYKALIQSTCAMIFLGTPHHGSEVANILDNTIRKMGLGFFLKPYFTELRSDSLILSEIDREFRQNIPRIQIVSFLETRGIPFTNLMVVKKTSAVLGYPGEMVMPLNTDHRMICKYRSPFDENYILFLCLVRKLVVDATRKLVPRKQQRNSTRHCFGNMEYFDHDGREHLPTWLAGSCQWILSNTSFISWMSDQERKPRVLLLCGPPGSGKSVLSTFIAQHLKTLINRPSCFFHVPSTLSGSVSLDVLLKSLVDQLSEQLPAFPLALAQFAQHKDRFDYYSWYIFWTNFVECLLHVEAENTIYWIIDEIDKFHDWESFVLALADLSAVNLPLRVLFVSEKNHLSHPFNKLGEALQLMAVNLSSLDGVKNDLRLVVTQRIENMHGIGSLKRDIIDYILTVANGNFLCADLLYQEIRRCHRKERLCMIFNKYPQGFTSYYQIMEMELRSRWTEDDQDDARVIMPWIIYAFGPLTVQQMQDGMQFLGVEFIDLQYVIARVCGRFVTVDGNSRVNVIHQTARHYMLAQKSVLSVEANIAHRAILMSCLLCFNTFEDTQTRPVREPGPFLGYAMKFWYRHLEDSNIDQEESVLNLVVKFFRGRGILVWIFLVSSAKELQHLIATALALNRFVSQSRRNAISPEDISFLERCSTDLCMVVERFSGPLLSNPEVIFELIPLFCPSKSFLKPVAECSKISIDELPHHEWDNYVATFTTYHGCRGSKIVSTNENFAVSTSTQEGLVLVYGSYRTSPIRKLVHGERVVSLLFNHSRTILATYGSMSTKLWDISTGTSLHTFTNAPDRNVLALAFTRNDKEIFAFCDDYILRKASINSSFHDWESIDLRLHGEYGNRWINPSCATFDHQSKLLAIGFTGDPLEIWDLLSFACIGRLGEETGLQYDLKQLNWSPQSDRIIARHRNGSLSVLDISRNEIIATCVDTTSTMASNSTVGFLVTGDRAGTIKVRRISDLALLYQIQGSESVIALSVAPSSGKIYDIRGTDCTVWEPSLLARVTAHIEDRDPLLPLAHLLQAPTLNSNVPPVTSLATCPRSSTYCVGYADGHIEVSLHGKEKIALDLPTKMRIERLLWCPNGRYLAIVDLAARIFVVSLDQQSRQFQTLIFSQLKSFVEQILFKQSSGFLLVVTRDDIVTWDLDTSVMAASRHTLGSDSRWINHPKKDNLLVGIGPRDIEIRQWHDHRIVSGISLNNSIAELTFCLEVLDYVKTEPSAVTLHPSVATCKVNKILISPDTSMMLLVTTRETKESISAPQFLLVSVADLDNAIISLQGVVCPIPLIESLSDVIAMPLAFLSRNSDERGQRQLPGGRLVFLDKENWICSVWVNAFNKEHPVQRHIFLPSDWLKLESVEFVQLGPGGEILIPKSEHIAIIRNALDVQY